MERPTFERLRDALSDEGTDSGPDLWPSIRARLEPARPVGRGSLGVRAGFALAAAVVLVLLGGTLATDRGQTEPRLDIRVIDVHSDSPTGDEARDEAARLLDAQRPTFLNDGTPSGTDGGIDGGIDGEIDGGDGTPVEDR